MSPASNRIDALSLWLPPRVLAVTAALFIAGLIAGLEWCLSGDGKWLSVFFSYPGNLFFLACNLLQTWLSFRCWSRFSRGDVLRPAWLMISLAALTQTLGGVLSHIFASESYLNPLWWLPITLRRSWTHEASQLGELVSPLFMVLLAIALSFVLRACHLGGVLGRLKFVDWILLAVVVAYTTSFFVTTVFAPGHGGRNPGLRTFISWSSDPLLCILLLQAILIRRSVANMGWGLISRCWISFTAAIFLTSVGDVGIWAIFKGYVPKMLQVVAWEIWFLPAAAYVLGPAYQLQAMVLATTQGTRAQPISHSEVTT